MHNATDTFKSTGNEFLDASLCILCPHTHDTWTVAALLARATMTLNADQIATAAGLTMLTVRLCLGNLARAGLARDAFQGEWMIVNDDLMVS